MLHSGYRVEGGLRQLWVDCQPLGGSVVQYYRDGVDREVRIFLLDGIAHVLDEVISSHLLTKFSGQLPGLRVLDGL